MLAIMMDNFCLLGNMKEYREALLSNAELQSDIKELRGRVEAFAIYYARI